MFNDNNIRTVEDLRVFLATADLVSIRLHCSHRERAEWIFLRLARFRYLTLRKRDKSIVMDYLLAVAGFSEKQLDRHIAAYKRGEKLCHAYDRHSFSPICDKVDAELLAKTDDLHAGDHGRLNGGAIQRICRKENARGDGRYVRLAAISIATIYRLRRTKRYREQAQSIGKTEKRNVSIGIRAKPEPRGEPGHLRADTVHQGDYEAEKGVYHVNTVDEVCQWEIPFAVEEISMGCMKNAVGAALEMYPFIIRGFHSDPGGEYINEKVAALLKKLIIVQTKSRPGKCTDNALIESKNGAVIRKHMGYSHIPQPFAARINRFYREHFIPYLNFHRPCWFPDISVDKKGRERRVYHARNIMTPYEKFLSLDHPEQYLRKGWTLERLADMANAKSPNQAAADMQRTKRELKKIIETAWKNMRPPEEP
jgi:transposase InsO family protein